MFAESFLNVPVMSFWRAERFAGGIFAVMDWLWGAP
jgi:hypothetical protein